jgi:hypothetical protein
LIGKGDPVLERYARVCFDKDYVRSADGKPAASLIAPGHPLLDSVIDLTIENFDAALRQGTVFVAEADPSMEPQLLVMAEHEVKDGVPAPDGNPRTISQRMQFVLMRANGAAIDAGAAPYLDMRPLETDEAPLIEKIRDADWLKGDLLARARAYASQNLAIEHLEEVKARRLAHTRKVEDEVRVRLKKEIAYWSRRADQHRLAIKSGKDERLALQKAETRASGLADRLELRLHELARERDISAATPAIRGGALVIPGGLLASLKGEGGVSGGFAEETVETERISMAAVMAAERAAGRTPVDVSMAKRGWDIETFTGDGEIFFLEVKGRVVGGREIIVTKNEMLEARNAGEKYFLVFVPVENGFAGQPVYVQNPARHFWDEGAFKDICRHYAVKDVIALGSTAPTLSGSVRK